jgi:hypothetical protein
VQVAPLIAALLACIAASPCPVAAQEERPQIIPGERKPTQKKDAGPRAVAVLQMAANGKASLVPIAILINNKFWDASAYKADPVPMALDSGTVYEAEQSGSSLGLFTVNSALHSNAVNSPAPWIGTGSWHPNGMEEPKKDTHVDNVPVGIDTEEKPPRLTHDQAKSPPANPAPNAGNNPGSTNTPASGTSKTGGSPSNSDEPPRLNKPASSPSQPPASPGSSSPSNSPGSAQNGSTNPPAKDDKKSTDSKPQTANIPASDSGSSEANRPKLRRGKPAESFADEDVPGYSRPGASSSPSPADAGKVVQTSATLADVKLIPAISDAGGPAPRSFGYDWLKGDEDDRRKQMTQAAKDQVRAYVAALARNRISATPTPKTTRPVTAHHAALPEPIIENAKMVAYDLWNSNQPIIVFSADAHMPAPPAGTAHSEVVSDTQYSVMLVGYPDIYGNLRKLYVGVTDKFHLDVTPQLQLVDALDADGDGRGELLFRETSDQGTGWVIYRATADKLWKMYDSLSPL